MQSLSSLMSHSPSFNSYSSSDKLTQIAARVVQEFQFDSDSKNSDEFLLKEEGEHLVTKNTQEEHDQNEDEEEEFEFAFVCKGADLSPIPADEIFYNGQIRPVYPLFDTKLLNADQVEVQNSVSSAIPNVSPPPRLPLGKLFVEERERDSASSCSSSESDELDGVPVETYCVWAPKAAEDSRECKKSNSTGTSKRWKFRDLLHKSSSDGKDTFAFLTQKREGISEKEEASKTTGNILKPKKSAVVTAGKETAPPPHYVKNGAAKENDRRRSYLPYKKDLVGLFSNVNGMNKPVRSS